MHSSNQALEHSNIGSLNRVLLKRKTCETKKCGPLEMCTTCELTPCNTYSCFNPDGTNIACKFPCKETPPTCICKPNYRRESPGAPCTRIRCPPDGM